MDAPSELPQKTWDEVYGERREKRPTSLKKLLQVASPATALGRPRKRRLRDEEAQEEGEEEARAAPQDLAADDPRMRRRLMEQAHDTSDFARVQKSFRSSYPRQKDVNLVWSPYETDKFYDALPIFGSDFTLMAARFPNRSRDSLKAKFDREDAADPDAVTEALEARIDIPDSVNPYTLPFLCQGDGWDGPTLAQYHQDLLARLKQRFPTQEEEEFSED